MSVSITKLHSNEAGEYCQFLNSLSYSLLYYSYNYKLFLEELIGSNANYYTVRENGVITGVLPLMSKNGEFGEVINSLPYFGSNGGVLANTTVAIQELVTLYNSLVSDPTVAAATIIENPLHPGIHLAARYDMQDTRIGQITSLVEENGHVVDLMKLIDSSARRNIRKALESGVSVSVENGALDFLEKAHNEGMQKVRGKTKSHRFFELLRKHFKEGNDYKIWVAKKDDQLVAALLLFYFNKTVEYFMPASLECARLWQPMASILVAAMKDAIARGFHYWNWGGTWLSQEGVYKFKKKWGGKDYHYNYFVKVSNMDVLSASSADLLTEYPDFYVVPFSALNN